MSLLEHCRIWLNRQTWLRADHPSGHNSCSNLRYRPCNVGLSEAEQQMKMDIASGERRRRRHIVHWQPGRIDYGDEGWEPNKPVAAECQKNKAPRRFSSYRSFRIRLHVAGNPEKVTCKKCLALIRKETNNAD
jgi:hypothetical protein